MSLQPARDLDGKFATAAAPQMPLAVALEIYNRSFAVTCRRLQIAERDTLLQLARTQTEAYLIAPRGGGRWNTSAAIYTDPMWLQAVHVRRLATYVANVGFAVPQLTLSKITGLHRCNVSRALREIEDARDDASCDALIECIISDVERRVS